MQLSHAFPAACKRLRIDVTTPDAAFEREATLAQIERMVDGGMKRGDALKAVGLASSTYYDWRKAWSEGGVKALAPKSRRPHSTRRRQWTNQDRLRVEELRAKRPWAGRACVHAILRNQHSDFRISAATVGRIIARAVRAGRLRPASHCEGRAKAKRQRDFSDAHAQRLPKGQKPAQPGDLVQIDHMTVTVDGKTFKEFHAKDHLTKALHVRVFSKATASAAAAFLKEAAQRMPIRSVQADGGSEFMGDFEERCREQGLPLFILPPRRPDLNGSVERSNRTLRTEFWSVYDRDLTVADVNRALDDYLDDYHNVRPHGALGWLTPAQFQSQHPTDCLDSKSSEM